MTGNTCIEHCARKMKKNNCVRRNCDKRFIIHYFYPATHFPTMARNLILLILSVVFSQTLHAQHDLVDSVQAAKTAGRSHLRISLITGSPGEELWETFGHACIRVIDSAKSGGERDVIYNYGFFDGAKGNIGSQFLEGRPQVFLDTITYDELIVEYVDKSRGLSEQLLLLNDQQKEQMAFFLKNNLRNENRYYEYDTFFDNCATRIRDLFTTVLGDDFVMGQVVQKGSGLTFRDVSINWYCPQQHKYWFGLGLNLFFAHRTDKVMSNKETMFLPEYLDRGIESATINGKNVSDGKKTILQESIPWTSTVNQPFVVILIVSLATIISLLFYRLRYVAKLTSATLLLLTGFLGCFMLYTSFLDGEPAWAGNYNILWALPTNIFVPLLNSRIRAKYAIVALCLIGVALFVHIVRIQVLPLFEITSLLVALVWVFGSAARRVYF
jgi:hypothetical protein